MFGKRYLLAALLAVVSLTATPTAELYGGHLALKNFEPAANNQGPAFSDYGDSYADGFDPETIITFLVTVEDPEGIEIVIASFRNQTENQWSNITMQDIDENSTRSRYQAYLHVEVPEPGVYVWDIRYVANDTLGHSSVSNVVQHSYKWDLPTSDPTPLIILAIAGVGTLVLAIGVSLKRNVLQPKG